MQAQAIPRKRLASTGNDIVALAATDRERTARYRFYSRILSTGEQAIYDPQISTGLPFDHFVWLVWSIKESVYKYCSRIDPSLLFYPLKISVSQLTPPSGDGLYKGASRYEGCTLYSQSVIQDATIVTVVSENENFDDTRWGFRAIGSADYESQSASVRKLALEALAAIIPATGLRIEKTPAGFPVVMEDKKALPIPLSLAHHDRYIAYSFRLPDAGANNCAYKKSAAN